MNGFEVGTSLMPQMQVVHAVPFGLISLIYLLSNRNEQQHGLSFAFTIFLSVSGFVGIMLLVFVASLLHSEGIQWEMAGLSLGWACVFAAWFWVPARLAKWAEEKGNVRWAYRVARFLDARWGYDPEGGGEVAGAFALFQSQRLQKESFDDDIQYLDSHAPKKNGSRPTFLAATLRQIPQADVDKCRSAMELLLLFPKSSRDWRGGNAALDWLLLDALAQRNLPLIERWGDAHLSGCFLGARTWTGFHRKVPDVFAAATSNPWVLQAKERNVRLANSPLRRQFAAALEGNSKTDPLDNALLLPLLETMSESIELHEDPADASDEGELAFDVALSQLGLCRATQMPSGWTDNVEILAHHLAKSTSVNEDVANSVSEEVISPLDTPVDDEIDEEEQSRLADRVLNMAHSMPTIPKEGEWAEEDPAPERIFLHWVSLEVAFKKLHDDEQSDVWPMVHYAVQKAACDLWNILRERHLPMAMWSYCAMGSVRAQDEEKFALNLENLRG
ncbi:MAG: hypothetical protein GY822_21120 [Deltaproteobacteria bacterium]|nr:hypothetical protein [Deltaproteobacteria bacterium]